MYSYYICDTKILAVSTGSGNSSNYSDAPRKLRSSMAGHILRDSFKPVDYKEGERSNLVLSEFHHIVDAAFLYTFL